MLYAVPGSPLVAERTVELLLGRRPGRRSRSLPGAVVPRPGLGPPRRRPRRRRACGWSTATASPSRPPASGARCWWPSATAPDVLSDVKLAARRRAPSRAHSADDADGRGAAARSGLPDERVERGGRGPSSTGRRARPPHVAVHPAAGRAGRPRAGRASTSWWPILRARVPVGPRADPRVAAPPPARGDLRGARGDRPPRRGRPATGYDHLEEELGDLLFQVVFHASWPPRRASSRWPTWPDACTTSSSPPPARVRRRRRPTTPTRWSPTGSRSRRPRRAARASFDGIPDALPGAALRPEGAEEGGDAWPTAASTSPPRPPRRCPTRPSPAPTSAPTTTPSATCCSPSSTWPAWSASTRRPPCAPPPSATATPCRRAELGAADADRLAASRAPVGRRRPRARARHAPRGAPPA